MRVLLRLFTFTLLILFLSCGNPTHYNSPRQTPFPPVIDTILVTTKYDTLTCLKILFSHPDTLPRTTFEIWKQSPGKTGYSRLIKGIPMTVRSYSDVMSVDTLPDFLNTVSYILYAVSPQDSVSGPSREMSITLTADAPEILSIDTAGGHPAVTYKVETMYGRSWTIDLVKRDSVLSSVEQSLTFAGEIFAYHFLNIRIADLKAGSSADSLDNGTYGIRIITTDGNGGFSIAAKGFNVKSN